MLTQCLLACSDLAPTIWTLTNRMMDQGADAIQLWVQFLTKFGPSIPADKRASIAKILGDQEIELRHLLDNPDETKALLRGVGVKEGGIIDVFAAVKRHQDGITHPPQHWGLTLPCPLKVKMRTIRHLPVSNNLPAPRRRKSHDHPCWLVLLVLLVLAAVL
jgi:hypothetical protein